MLLNTLRPEPQLKSPSWYIHSRGLTPTAADPDIKTHLLEAARIALQWVHLLPTEGVDYLASSHLIGLPKSDFSMSQLIFWRKSARREVESVARSAENGVSNHHEDPEVLQAAPGKVREHLWRCFEDELGGSRTFEILNIMLRK